ncbi:MAG: hypothetical protein NTV22_10410 [bacterium]|nr:hypothetical protein [bacterium]
MKSPVHFLALVVTATAWLLVVVATLLVLGIFNEALHWDIFGPRVEAILTGVFGACGALAGVGVALTMVLGVADVVRSFRSLHAALAHQAPTPPPARGSQVLTLAGIALAMTALVVGLAFVNGAIQRHRSGVFKRLAQEQMAHFAPKLAAQLPLIHTPPTNAAPADLQTLMQTLNDFSFVSSVVLYIPDSTDAAALWEYAPTTYRRSATHFTRFFIAKDLDRAMRQAFDGDSHALEASGARMPFEAYFIIRDAAAAPRAVLRVWGNQQENFREYRSGS